MKKGSIKTFRKSILTIHFDNKEIDVLDKLKDKLCINVGSKALKKACELIVTENNDTQISNLKTELISYKRILFNILQGLENRQKAEQLINSYITSHLEDLTKDIENYDRLKALEKPAKYLFSDKIENEFVRKGKYLFKNDSEA